MTDDEAAAFLTQRGHGVISFGGAQSHAIPISFGFDADENRCILHSFSGSDSRKRECLERSETATLVAYELSTPDDWRSVIVRGRLTSLDDSTTDVADAAAVFSNAAAVPSLAVFDAEPDELTATWYELTVDEMSGMHAPHQQTSH